MFEAASTSEHLWQVDQDCKLGSLSENNNEGQYILLISPDDNNKHLSGQRPRKRKV
jgi:hypothetical protein